MARAYHNLNAAALQAYRTDQIVHFHYLLREFLKSIDQQWKSPDPRPSMDSTETVAKFYKEFEKARRAKQTSKPRANRPW